MTLQLRCVRSKIAYAEATPCAAGRSLSRSTSRAHTTACRSCDNSRRALS